MIPESVKKAGLEADELLKQLTGESTNTGPENTFEPEKKEALEPAPKTDPEKQPEPGKEVEPDLELGKDKVGEETWEARFKVLQGKYNAEVPRLTDQVHRLTAEINRHKETESRLTAEIQTLKQAPPAGGDKPNPDGAVSIAELTEEYGDKFVNSLRSLFKQEFDKHGKPSQAEEEPKPKTAAEVPPEAAPKAGSYEELVSEVAKRVPDWALINDSKEFKQWCLVKNEMGFTYQEILDLGVAKNDPSKVIGVFNAFKALKQAQVHQKEKEMEEMTSPSKGGDDDPGKVNTKGQTYSRAEVQKFYSDVRRGEYVGRETERLAKENLYEKAALEGRLVD